MRLCVGTTDRDRLISVYRSLIGPSGNPNVSITVNETILGSNYLAYVGKPKELIRVADSSRPVDHEIIGIELFVDFTSNGIDSQRILFDIACQRAQNTASIFKRTFDLFVNHEDLASFGFQRSAFVDNANSYNPDYTVGLARGTATLGEIELDTSFIALRSAKTGQIAVGSHDSFPHYGSILANVDLDSAAERRALASLEIISGDAYEPRSCCPRWPIRKIVRETIFGKDFLAAVIYNIFIWWVIMLSVISVIVDSIPGIGSFSFEIIDWVCLGIFSVDFLLKVWSTVSIPKYLFSAWGVIDVISLLPSYIDFAVDDARPLLNVRLLKLMRIFRILKLGVFRDESQSLHRSLIASKHRIIVFFLGVFCVTMFISSIMYVLENDGNPGFSSIPQTMYWTMVTIATVGFGDVVPYTSAGKFIASLTILVGYATIAIPTGIVAVEFATTEILSETATREGASPTKTTAHVDAMLSDVDHQVQVPTNNAPEPFNPNAYAKCMFCTHTNRDTASFCALCGQQIGMTKTLPLAEGLLKRSD